MSISESIRCPARSGPAVPGSLCLFQSFAIRTCEAVSYQGHLHGSRWGIVVSGQQGYSIPYSCFNGYGVTSFSCFNGCRVKSFLGGGKHSTI